MKTSAPRNLFSKETPWCLCVDDKKEQKLHSRKAEYKTHLKNNRIEDKICSSVATNLGGKITFQLEDTGLESRCLTVISAFITIMKDICPIFMVGTNIDIDKG